MKKFLVPLAVLISIGFAAQTYPPQAGQEGSTAIHKDSPLFKSWATGCMVVRGPQQINGTEGLYATVGTPENVIGIPDGVNVVSLGDGGTATVTFAKYITDGEGPDFAVFENGFISNFTGRAFLELAFVEVSSDGENFFRFPSHNEYPADFVETTTDDPGGSGFASMDARYLNNFAGKYISNYGTPFDLSELPDSPQLDKQHITHVRVVDVVGTNLEGYRTYDSLGNVAIDSFPTPFASSGFDLDAIGVINEGGNLAVETISERSKISIYPNPANDFVKINSDVEVNVNIFDMNGKLVKQGRTNNKTMNITDVPKGVYVLQTDSGTERKSFKLLISK